VLRLHATKLAARYTTIDAARAIHARWRTKAMKLIYIVIEHNYI